ncbi:oleate hydratase [Clostridium sp. LIBA-8841]|uniref:oleate hydratase n=1 Tax=Clostridium sp. LIBA-8841 TaxID=2987530 RepID=UPI002AC48991|nr:oleate hydratase [Clostridium sp. LIBA-8841]MDZ5254447.1 oleate hydratase [Clostridium sp. LIBA-8841]
MENYLRIKTDVPEGIDKRKAYLVGGGIASLAAAFYLIRDGHMPGKNITIFEKLDIDGGSLDAAGDPEHGYVCRGGRELESHYECTWDLFGEIPSLEKEGYSILDEFKELNDKDPNSSNCRLLRNCGEKINLDDLGLTHEHVKKITKLFLATEDALDDVTIEQFFDPSFFETNFWRLWYSMFAFNPWHSVLEMKRYMERFIHAFPGFAKMDCLVFTKYNQYESFVLPLTKYLKEKGVNFEYKTDVKDLDIEVIGKQKTVTGIHLVRDGQTKEHIDVLPRDLVMVTNGSMTECTGYGDLDTVPQLIREPGSIWTLWENIAKNSPDFGHPKVFCGDIDKSKWESFTITCKKSKLTDKIHELSGRDPFAKNKTVTGGVITATDSNWLMSVTCNRQPQFKEQPDDIVVLWAYGLRLDKEGNYIKKKMEDCTGRELLEELLYHLGLEKDIPEILKTVKVIPTMMPYITAQFMPRAKGDRPEVVPEGCVNLAFLGQFVEIPGDVIFTVEYSVRSAMMATYKLLNINKKPPIVYPSQFDIRAIINAMKTLNSGKSFPGEEFAKKLLKGTNYEGLI